MADFFDALNALEEVNKHIEGGSPENGAIGNSNNNLNTDDDSEPVQKRIRTEDTRDLSEPAPINPSLNLEDDIPKVVIKPRALTERLLASQHRQNAAPVPSESEEQLDEDLGVAETYSDYVPAKLDIGYRHPDPIVESASLASVEVPDVGYELLLPQTIFQKRLLSGLQLEAVVYSCQRHEKVLPDGSRAGFLIGDGAGVGKGRSIAGIIYENYLQGRKKAVWFSVSNDLKYDAERDLRDIGADKIKVHLLAKLKYAKLSSSNNGKVKKGVLFSTYLSLIGESQRPSSTYGTRFKQILEWCGTDFDGLIIFDECHRAKNLLPSGSQKPTKTAQTVIKLQEALPNARVVYSSATGAVEPRHLAYMIRLGLWGYGTTFPSFVDFLSAVEKRGVGAMEMVAMDMKLRGMYLARQLSFKGVSFRTDEVKLKTDFVSIYNACVKLWRDTRIAFQEALALLKLRNKTDTKAWSLFWSAHQRFFKHLCLAAKVEECANIAQRAIRDGKCVIIGLQSTGEARIMEALEDAADADGYLEDFVSTATGVYQNLVEKHFPGLTYQKASHVLLKETLQNVATARQNVLPDWVTRGSLKTPPRDTRETPNSTTPQQASSGYTVFPSSTHSTEFPEILDNDEDDNEDTNPFALYEDDDDDDPWIRRVRTSNKNDEKKEESRKERKMDDASQVPTQPQPEVERTESTAVPSSDMFGNRKGRLGQRKAKPWLKRRKNVFEQGDSDDNEGDSSEDPGQSSDSDNEVVDADLDSEADDFSSDDDEESEEATGVDEEVKTTVTADVQAKLTKMRTDLLKRFQDISDKLPPNALDRLVNLLGGPKKVAEMTGRRGRLVADHHGSVTISHHHQQHGGVRYEVRGADEDMPLEVLNIVEKQRFMDGTKLIAIISEAASVGISLQADRRAANQRRRVHITLELPWSADKAVQQFGRSHRSNQTSAPEYILLISELAGEQRFASGVARRLESLGALTHGDRRVADSTQDLSQFNFDNVYGRKSLDKLMKAVAGLEASQIPPPPGYYPPNSFFNQARQAFVDVGLMMEPENKPAPTSAFSHTVVPAMLERDHTNVARFMNRLLGVDVKLQNAVFSFFGEILKLTIQDARRSGQWDSGILDLSPGRNNAHLVDERSFLSQHVANELQDFNVSLYTVMIDRGMSFEEISRHANTLTGPEDGFYLSNNSKAVNLLPILIEAISPTTVATLSPAEAKQQLYRIYRPNLGLQVRKESLNDLLQRYRKSSPDEVRILNYFCQP